MSTLGVVPHQLAEAIAPLLEAIAAEAVSARSIEPGDIPLHWDGEVVIGVRLHDLQGLHGALDRLIAAAEREMGSTIEDLDREEKQRMVAMLDDMGAFTLRKSVEDVADALGVSRFTVYNYLNALPGRR
ncbi:MAG: helix-turn-helix domain-containing protein [Acidimicrobiia bacterium]|nr:helix-turn-helix domain-containing protein [Acidimicrobiia bacterium]